LAAIKRVTTRDINRGPLEGERRTEERGETGNKKINLGTDGEKERKDTNDSLGYSSCTKGMVREATKLHGNEPPKRTGFNRF